MPNNTKKDIRLQRLVEAAKEISARSDNPMLAKMYAYAVEKFAEGNAHYLRFMNELEEPPVDIETFLDSEDFMASTDLTLWPVVRQAIIDICKDWYKGLEGGAIKEVLLTGATGCVDMQTEFLSRSGWKRICDYEEGDEVLQYHEDGTASWVKPTEYIERPVSHFYHFKSKTVDQMLTAGHRMIFRAYKSGKITERSAEYVANRHNERANGYSAGKFICSYDLQGGKGLLLTDDQIKVYVAAYALGRHTTENGLQVECKIRCPEKAKALAALLKSTRTPYSSNLGSNGVDKVYFALPKRMDNYSGWYSADKRQLQLIAEQMLLWTGVKGRSRLYTYEQGIADFIQHVFTSLGKRATITEIERSEGKSYGEYCVNICSSDSTGILSSNKPTIPMVPVLGVKCYCFTVPTGMWVMRRSGKIVVTGNTGKSEISKVVTAYFLHVLGCMKNPQKFYDLPSATSIVIPIQAAKPNVTKKIVYAPLRKYVETMPWFIRKMRPNKLIESEMLFEGKNIRVVQGGSESDAILGEAVIGNITDEINFMNVVENSKKAGFVGGRSGNYDQAQQIYDAVTKRRKGRFLSQGPHVGVQIFSSSRRYKGDFTDRRQAQVEELQEPNVYIYDKAQYEAAPSHRYSGEIFWLALTGESNSEIRIVEDESEIPLGATILEVPVEYLEDFKKDASGSLRDIIGKSTHAISPFFRKRQVIQNIFDRGRELGLTSILHKDNVILGIEGMPRVRRERYCTNPSKPRYVHIDLSLTSDSCGIAMLCYEGMVVKERKSGVVERLPSASVDFACSITPDHAAEIDIAEVRTWVKQLKDVYGYPIKAVTYDGWQSAESRQQWRKTGMKTGIISVDKSSSHYKNLRDAMADGRIACHEQEVLYDELCQLEYDEKKDKVDHPPVGSKDVADALCGAFSNLLNRSSTWVGAFSKMEDPAMEGRQMLDDRFDGERSA